MITRGRETQRQVQVATQRERKRGAGRSANEAYEAEVKEGRKRV